MYTVLFFLSVILGPLTPAGILVARDRRIRAQQHSEEVVFVALIVVELPCKAEVPDLGEHLSRSAMVRGGYWSDRVMAP